MYSDAARLIRLSVPLSCVCVCLARIHSVIECAHIYSVSSVHVKLAW